MEKYGNALEQQHKEEGRKPIEIAGNIIRPLRWARSSTG
jgi:hypothetical protein